MDIQIENLQKKLNLKNTPIQNLIKAILKYKGISDSNLNVVFVTAQKIRAINIKHLNHHYVTDVITFDYSESRGRSRATRTLDGEIIISTDAVRQNAREYGTTEAHELILYIVHGILHLLGLKDKTAKDKEKMRKAEAQVMGYLGKKIEKVIA